MRFNTKGFRRWGFVSYGFGESLNHLIQNLLDIQHIYMRQLHTSHSVYVFIVLGKYSGNACTYLVTKCKSLKETERQWENHNWFVAWGLGENITEQVWTKSSLSDSNSDNSGSHSDSAEMWDCLYQHTELVWCLVRKYLLTNHCCKISTLVLSFSAFTTHNLFLDAELRVSKSIIFYQFLGNHLFFLLNMTGLTWRFLVLWVTEINP